MLADFSIPRLSNAMKIDVSKNNLGGQIWYRSLDPVKKRRQCDIYKLYETVNLYTEGIRC